MKYNKNFNNKHNSDIWYSASTSLNHLQYSDAHSIVNEEDGYVSTQDNSGNSIFYRLPEFSTARKRISSCNFR